MSKKNPTKADLKAELKDIRAELQAAYDGLDSTAGNISIERSRANAAEAKQQTLERALDAKLLELGYVNVKHLQLDEVVLVNATRETARVTVTEKRVLAKLRSERNREELASGGFIPGKISFDQLISGRPGIREGVLGSFGIPNGYVVGQ